MKPDYPYLLGGVSAYLKTITSFLKDSGMEEVASDLSIRINTLDYVIQILKESENE